MGRSLLEKLRLLRNILLVIASLLVLAFLGFGLSGAHGEARVIKAFEARGVSVDYNYHGPRWLRRTLGEHNPFKSAVNLEFPPGIRDGDLPGIEAIRSIESIHLNRTKVRGPGLEHLKDLPHLQSIELNGSEVDDDGTRFLEGLTTLRSLSLSSDQVTDAGLKHLRGLTNLNVLTLRQDEVSDRGLDELTGLPLTLLDIRNTKVTSNGVARIRNAVPGVSVMGP